MEMNALNESGTYGQSGNEKPAAYSVEKMRRMVGFAEKGVHLLMGYSQVMKAVADKGEAVRENDDVPGWEVRATIALILDYELRRTIPLDCVEILVKSAARFETVPNLPVTGGRCELSCVAESVHDARYVATPDNGKQKSNPKESHFAPRLDFRYSRIRFTPLTRRQVEQRPSGSRLSEVRRCPAAQNLYFIPVSVTHLGVTVNGQ
jgi:hypothetical protein